MPANNLRASGRTGSRKNGGARGQPPACARPRLSARVPHHVGDPTRSASTRNGSRLQWTPTYLAPPISPGGARRPQVSPSRARLPPARWLTLGWGGATLNWKASHLTGGRQSECAPSANDLGAGRLGTGPAGRSATRLRRLQPRVSGPRIGSAARRPALAAAHRALAPIFRLVELNYLANCAPVLQFGGTSRSRDVRANLDGRHLA